MVTDVLDHLHFLLSVVLPIVDIVNTLLLLEPLQKLLVFLSDSLRFNLASSLVE